MMRNERIFPLCQALEAGEAVTGAALVRVFLGDLYRRNTEIPISALTSNHLPGKLVGAWVLETLCEDLSVKDSFPSPNTFARAQVLVTQAGKDVKECLIQGFIEMKLNFLPAFTFRDIRGTKRICWNCKDYVQIHQSSGKPFAISVVAQMTLQVCVEMERRSLTYSRNLEKYREHGMPWMEKVIARLPQRVKGLPNTLLRTLTFLYCIGMVMNGDYVDFNHLRDLLTEMSHAVSQADIQKMQILSR